MSFEVNYARHVVDAGPASLFLEVPFVANTDEDLHAAQNVIPEKFSSYFVTPAARLNIFPDQAVSPWISLWRIRSFRESSTLVFGSESRQTGLPRRTPRRLGLDVRFFHRFSLRGEVRTSGRESPAECNHGQ